MGLGMKNLKLAAGVGIVAICNSGISWAERVACHGVMLGNVAVQGPRDDNHFFQNRLTIKLIEDCAGKRYIHANLDHPAFDGFLSVALTAKTLKKAVNIAVNTSQATSISNQIAYISLPTD